MPKWGLAMQEGMVAKWLVEEGARSTRGDEILDIETSKIANVFESPVAGPLRRRLVGEGETVPVGALLGVVADSCGAGGRARRLRRRVPGGVRGARRRGRRDRARAGDDRGRRPAAALPGDGRGRGAAGRVHPRLRRRPLQLAVQPGGAGREPRDLRARPAGPWRLDQGPGQRPGRRRRAGGAR